MQCGRVGFGNFKLLEDYSYAKLDPDEIQISELRGRPKDMLKKAKQQLDNLVNKLEDNGLNTETEINIDQQGDHQCSNEIIDKLIDKNATTVGDKEDIERKGGN